MDNKKTIVIDILDKLQFFQGQRAGRELWADKPTEVQEEDLKNFNRDIKIIKEYISKNDAYWIDHGTLDDYPAIGVNNYHLLVCSECGCCHRTRLQDNTGKPFNGNYCPACGRKMENVVLEEKDITK